MVSEAIGAEAAKKPALRTNSVEGIGDKRTGREAIQRTNPVGDRASAGAADVAIDATKHRCAPRLAELIFDGAKAADRCEAAMRLIGIDIAVQERFGRCDREIFAHELIVAELEARADGKRKGAIALDQIDLDIGIEALGAADPLARLDAGAEEFGRPEFDKAAKFGGKADIVEAKEVVVVAKGSNAAAEGAF